MTIECKQSVMTERATLVTVTQQSDELIENHVSKIPELIRHHYTAKQQARYLKRVKRNSAIRPMHNFGRFLRELFIYTPRCHKRVLTVQANKQFFIPSLIISKINT
jgi:hypothetical protein